MAQDPHPEGQAEERGEHKEADHPEAEGQVLADPAAGQTAEPDGEGQCPEVVAD